MRRLLAATLMLIALTLTLTPAAKPGSQAHSVYYIPCVLGGPSPAPTATTEPLYLVTYVVDGDTIDVEIDGAIYRVRYIGIDAPDRGDCYFDEAKLKNSELVMGRYVRLVKDVSETDLYGRLLRYVYVGETFVNYELVWQGYALASTYPPDVAHAQEFAQAQHDAQQANRGLWAGCVTPTATETEWPSVTPTSTAVEMPTATRTPTRTVTPTPTMTTAATRTPTLTGTLTPTPSGSPTSTNTPAPPTSTFTPEPTKTATPTLSGSETPTPTRSMPYDLRITHLQYKGGDEYVQITSYEPSSAVDMTGWEIERVDSDYRYSFPYAFVLAAGAWVRVHSGPDSFESRPTDLQWTLGYRWTDSGGAAQLVDPQGQVVSVWEY